MAPARSGRTVPEPPGAPLATPGRPLGARNRPRSTPRWKPERTQLPQQVPRVAPGRPWPPPNHAQELLWDPSGAARSRKAAPTAEKTMKTNCFSMIFKSPLEPPEASRWLPGMPPRSPEGDPRIAQGVPRPASGPPEGPPRLPGRPPNAPEDLPRRPRGGPRRPRICPESVRGCPRLCRVLPEAPQRVPRPPREPPRAR